MTSHEREHDQPEAEDSHASDKAEQSHERRMYLRFGLMIATSTTVMFVLTYTNAFAVDHVRWSEERFYMAVLMGAAMALVMFAFMRSMMYKNGTLNIIVIATAVVLGSVALYLSRSQVLVDDQAYMKGMIPHHSIAILTSERADIDDVRVRQLADDIIKAQRKEIKEMDWLIEDIEENGPAKTEEEAQQRPIPDFDGQAAGVNASHRELVAAMRLLGLIPEHHPEQAGIDSTG